MDHLEIHCQDPLCRRQVRSYRQCGAGCGLIRAYCAEHGGEERAVVEMATHIKETHSNA